MQFCKKYKHDARASGIRLKLPTRLRFELEFEQVDQGQQLRRARELLQQRQVLVIWENFESILPQFSRDESHRSHRTPTSHSSPHDNEIHGAITAKDVRDGRFIQLVRRSRYGGPVVAFSSLIRTLRYQTGLASS
jgi:hypothetical protein